MEEADLAPHLGGISRPCLPTSPHISPYLATLRRISDEIESSCDSAASTPFLTSCRENRFASSSFCRSTAAAVASRSSCASLSTAHEPLTNCSGVAMNC